MDPLSADEIRIANQIVRTDSRIAAAPIPIITLEEPSKEAVLGWESRRQDAGLATIPRRARAIVATNSGIFEASVNITDKRLISVVERQGVQGPVTSTESMEVSRIVLGNTQFQESLKARGLTNVSKVFCAPFTAGYYGIPEQEGKRILVVGCFDTQKATNNVFGWPIERLYAVVDLRARNVVQVVDYGAIPISSSNQNFRESDIEGVRDHRKATFIAQPNGANVEINGNEVSWGNWTFHVRLDARVGPIISLVRWRDRGSPRPVLYQGSLSEMFVPYMDPNVGWYSRTYFDAGEYGAGLMASPLKPGVDCPEASSFMPATFSNDKGEPFTTPRAVCIFERDRGEPIWRHGTEGRRDVELVVRMAAAVGNYDYLFDWVFNDAAEIEVRVGATGIVALKGVRAQRMSDATAAEDTRYGTLIAPGLVGTNHDQPKIRGTAHSSLPDSSAPTTIIISIFDWTWISMERRTASAMRYTKKSNFLRIRRGEVCTSCVRTFHRMRNRPNSIQATLRKSLSSSTRAKRTRWATS
jgi:primary-amine oxidase